MLIDTPLLGSFDLVDRVFADGSTVGVESVAYSYRFAPAPGGVAHAVQPLCDYHRERAWAAIARGAPLAGWVPRGR